MAISCVDKQPANAQAANAAVAAEIIDLIIATLPLKEAAVLPSSDNQRDGARGLGKAVANSTTQAALRLSRVIEDSAAIRAPNHQFSIVARFSVVRGGVTGG